MYSNNLGALPPRPMMAPIMRGRPMAPAFRPIAPARPILPTMQQRLPAATQVQVMRPAPPPAPVMAPWAANRVATAEARRRAMMQHTGYRAGQDARIQTAVNAAVAARLAQQQIPGTSSVVYPTPVPAMSTMPTPAPSSQVSPASPEADLTPHQDAASDAAEAAAPSPSAPPPGNRKMLFIVGGVLVAAVVGVVVVKKIRSGKKHGHSRHAAE